MQHTARNILYNKIRDFLICHNDSGAIQGPRQRVSICSQKVKKVKVLYLVLLWFKFFFDFLDNTAWEKIAGLTKEVWNIFHKYAYTDASIFGIKYSEVGMRLLFRVAAS